MGLYDALKDVIAIAQKADNIELYKQLLDIGSQALDLQAENSKLKEENVELKKKKIDEERIVRHSYPYITLTDDSKELCYCAVCWDKDRQLIQMVVTDDTMGGPQFGCRNCGTTFWGKLENKVTP